MDHGSRVFEETETMKRYVQTRAHARSLDYDWLGGRPGHRWWEKYKTHTFFEHRTLIVEGDGSAWRLYASALPSARHDAVGTEIRHAVVLEGDVSEESGRAETFRVLGAALLDPDKVGLGLDEQLDEDFVTRCLSEPGDYADDVDGRLSRAFAALSSREIDPEPMGKGEVAWGGTESPDGLIGLARRAAAMITGASTGVAALLNLVHPSDLPLGLAEDGSAALLVDGSTDSWRSIPKAKPEPGPSSYQSPGNRTFLIKLGLVLLGLVAAGVIGYLLYRRFQSPPR
jgi:hypothetical protein